MEKEAAFEYDKSISHKVEANLAGRAGVHRAAWCPGRHRTGSKTWEILAVLALFSTKISWYLSKQSSTAKDPERKGQH